MLTTKKLLVFALFAGIVAAGYGLSRTPPAFADDGGKNLKILPKTMSKADIKKYMKQSVAEALGVQCDYCHNTDDMSQDTPKKERARDMMKMVAQINKDNFKGQERVKCVTCHNGAAKPK